MMRGVAETVAYHADVCAKTQIEIAKEAGFRRPNMISMIKSGASRVPLVRVISLAKALGLDEIAFFRLCMSEYEPELLAICDQIYAQMYSATTRAADLANANARPMP